MPTSLQRNTQAHEGKARHRDHSHNSNRGNHHEVRHYHDQQHFHHHRETKRSWRSHNSDPPFSRMVKKGKHRLLSVCVAVLVLLALSAVWLPWSHQSLQYIQGLPSLLSSPLPATHETQPQQGVVRQDRVSETATNNGTSGKVNKKNPKKQKQKQKPDGDKKSKPWTPKWIEWQEPEQPSSSYLSTALLEMFRVCAFNGTDSAVWQPSQSQIFQQEMLDGSSKTNVDALQKLASSQNIRRPTRKDRGQTYVAFQSPVVKRLVDDMCANASQQLLTAQEGSTPSLTEFVDTLDTNKQTIQMIQSLLVAGLTPQSRRLALQPLVSVYVK